MTERCRLGCENMKIIGRYFETTSDFVNLVRVSKQFKDLLEKYLYNPVSDTRLFPKIRNQHFYRKEDRNYTLRSMDSYVFWYKTDQLEFLKRHEKEYYKRVVLTNYAHWRLNNEGRLIEDSVYEYDETEDNEYCGSSPIPSVNGSCIVPEGITELGPYCFANCYLTHIQLPRSLKTIGAHAFQSNCIREIDIPEGVTSIGDSAFTECWELETVKLHPGLRKIGDWCFYLVYIPALTVPDTVIDIGEESFHDVHLLTLPVHLESVGRRSNSLCN